MWREFCFSAFESEVLETQKVVDDGVPACQIRFSELGGLAVQQEQFLEMHQIILASFVEDMAALVEPLVVSGWDADACQRLSDFEKVRQIEQDDLN